MTLRKGFTLIELLVVIGIIGILAAIVVIAVNPGRQFAQARDTQRRSDLLGITNAVYQFAAEHDGNLPTTDDTSATSNFPTAATCIGDTAPCYNLAAAGDAATLNDGAFSEVLVPTYIAEIPVDPSTGDSTDTGYTIHVNADGRVVASAVGELTPSITITR
jgi:prepilin-type N-terminal cleavage/methylation domain-containing protein